LPRAAPWRDVTRPTLDETYYNSMKARPTRFQREFGFDLIDIHAIKLRNELRLRLDPQGGSTASSRA